MINQVGNHKALMVVRPSNEVALTGDHPANRHTAFDKRDVIVLDNQSGFNSYSGEKGTLINLYA